MNYYIHNIGDYAIETKFMTFEEKGIFVDMVDQYLATGKPLASDWLANLKRVASEETVNAVLSAHFVQDGDIWRSAKLDELIASYDKRAQKNRENARRGRSKANAINDLLDADENKATGMPVASESLPSRSKPLTINHKPLIEGERQTPNQQQAACRRTPSPLKRSFIPKEVQDGSVDPQAWEDFIRVRGKPVSVSFWNGFRAQAALAHLTVPEAVKICAERGWKRIDANWESIQKQESTEERLKRLMGVSDAEQ